MLWAHSMLSDSPAWSWQHHQGAWTGGRAGGRGSAGLTLQVENPRKGKLDIQSTHSSAVFLQLAGEDGVSSARKAEPSRALQTQMLQLKFSLSPFQHLFAKLPLKLLEQLFCKCWSCHRISAQEIRVIINRKTHEQ